MHPALGVNDIRDTRTGSANRELERTAVELTAFQVVEEGFDFGFVGYEELDVVSGGPAEVTVAGPDLLCHTFL